MAEETQGVKNIGLLVAAIAVGVAVVIIYNVHIERVRSQAEGGRVQVLRYARDMRAGDEILMRDLKVFEVDAASVEAINGWARRRDTDFLVTSTLRQDVRDGEPVLMGHVTGGSGERPANSVGLDKVGTTLELDSTTSPGTICRVGDRVNITGIFEVQAGRPQAYRVLADVKVLALGGRGPDDPTAPGARRSQGNSRTYRSIMIEVSDDVSLMLENLKTRLIGAWGVEIRNPADPERNRPGELSPLLRDIAKAAAVVRAPGAAGP